MSTPIGIYFHVPFCAQKCPYCDFYSVSYRAETVQAYTNAAIRVLQSYPQGLPVDTIYFGGGTPSLLPVDCLERLLKAVRTHCVVHTPEITLEVNPVTATTQKLEAWRVLGINRLSFGMQSCVDAELRELGRRHTTKQACQAVEHAAALGFTNLSCDLMLGIAGQTKASLHQSLCQLTALPVQHLSLYMLSIEPGTPFDCAEMRQRVADSDTVADWYLQTVTAVQAAGFLQYEISNFAKPGFEGRHNLKYWHCEEYIGIGPAAHSCYGGKRYATPPDLEGFLLPKRQTDTVTDAAPCSLQERAMLQLRLTEGISLHTLPDATAWLRRAAPLQRAGFVQRCGDRLSLTAQGFLVSNAVILRLLGE